MNQVSTRLLFVLAWIFGTGLLAARPGQTHSFANPQPAAPLTTISVTTPVDEFTANNTCSLREAVYAAVHDVAVDACAAGAASDVISLPAATYALTLTGEIEDGGLTGDLDITGTLKITGVTSATTIIDGNQTDRILDIFSGAVALDNLTLRNGRAWSVGGAIRLRSGALNVDQSSFDHNLVDGYYNYGGAIGNEAGTASITRSVFTANKAYAAYMYATGDGGVLSGGSNSSTMISDSVIQDTVYGYKSNTIYNSGYLSVRGTVFRRNVAPIFNNGTALIENTRFLSNTVTPVENLGQITVNDSEFAFNTTPIDEFYCVAGGAISNRGQASINRTSIHHNRMEYGGGIASTGRTDIRNSSIVHNTAPRDVYRGRDYCDGAGGGIYVPSGVLTVENSTIANNWAGYAGGGIYSSNATTIITNTTIVNNYSNECHIFYGCEWPTSPDAGGIYAYAPVTLTNVLVAHNTSRVSPSGSDCAGPLVGANSLILAPTAGCTITATASLIGVDPLLGPLADHGGATLSYSLLPNSPAIDAGAPAGCPDHDQRGVFRPQDGDASGGAGCDIGAYEYVNPQTAVTATPTTIPTVTTAPTATSTATATTSPTVTATPTATSTATATTSPTATSTATATATATQPTATPATATATTTATQPHAVYLPLISR